MHMSIPVFHVHSPHIEHKEYYFRVRQGVVSLIATLLLMATAALAWTVLPQVTSETGTAVAEWSNSLPSTAGWQYPRERLRYEHMYAPNVRAPSVDSMYAKPRPRYFDR